MKRTLPLALLCLAFLSASVRAQADMPDGKWWKRPRLAAEIGLTADQQDHIERIFVRSRTKLIDLRADLEKKQVTLQSEMEDKAADRRDIERQIGLVENARAELQKARALMILDIKQVLRPDQWQKLVRRQQSIQERRSEIRERLREKMRAEGENR